MSDTSNPTSCCSTTAAPQPEGRPGTAAPCCGSAQDAAEAQACCAPAAKQEAQATGSTCC